MGLVLLTRRSVVQQTAVCSVLGTAAAATAPVAAAARTRGAALHLANRTPQDDLMLWAKLKADLSGKTLYSITTGMVWGFRPQADDLTLDEFARRLYGYATCTARRGSIVDGGRVSIRSKSWNFYLHPDTLEFARQVLNPYTGKVVPSAPMIASTRQQIYSVDGPIETPSIPLEVRKPTRPFDLRVRIVGEHAFVDETSFVRFKPLDISWHKLEGTLWSHSCLVRDLTDTSLSHVPSTWSQNLIAEWQTWMGMHGAPGHILFKGDGCNVRRAEQIPDDIRRNIETVTPGGLEETLVW